MRNENDNSTKSACALNHGCQFIHESIPIPGKHFFLFQIFVVIKATCVVSHTVLTDFYLQVLKIMLLHTH